MRIRTFATWVAFVCSTGLGCGDDATRRVVGTGGGDEPDSGSERADSGASSPRGEQPIWPEAETEIVLPYRGGDVDTEFTVNADLGQLDVHINVDTTASFGEEIDALQRSLRGDIVSTLSRRVAHVSFGVSRFADYPVHPFGSDEPSPGGDRAYVLLSPVTSDLSRVTNAVARLDSPLGFGGDEREASAESLYQVATGAGHSVRGTTYIARWDRHAATGGGELGGVGFRPQALRLVIHVADTRSHTPAEYARKGITGTHDMADAITALRGIAARTIAVMSTDCVDDECRKGNYGALRAELSELALHTLAVMEPVDGMCPTGIEGALLPTYKNVCPLVFDVRTNGTGLADTIIDAVLGLLDRLRFGQVHAATQTDPLDFVQSIAAITVEQAPGVDAPQRVDRFPAGEPDGLRDTFLAVQKRNRLGFRVRLRNDRIPPAAHPQRFRASVSVIGDGVALEERTLRLVVPAHDGSTHGLPDAGPDAGPDAAALPDAALDAASRADSSLDAASTDDSGQQP